MALLVDLRLGCSPEQTGAFLLKDTDLQVFLLCGDRFRDTPDTFLTSSRQTHILDCRSTTESLYQLKQTVDRLDISVIRVLTSPEGRAELSHYQRLLFTDVYKFDYAVTPLDTTMCPSGKGSAHKDTPGQRIEAEVSAFLQQLPGLHGDVRVLKSTLIPGCFGHGFSTRTGGVSYIPTLSSMNLFCSSRRRDPVAVVTENRRRLAVHASFHPLPLRMVKVNHASDVWVLGKAEPESYDALVTDQRGVVLAAPGADCMPILFSDPVKKVIGAAHAGWKGTLMGVAMATVNAMVMEFGSRASDIRVAVGPSVGVCCFTLDREQALEFRQIHTDCVPDPKSAKPHVDIRLANRVLLQKGGVLPERIHDNLVMEQPSVTPCTSCHPEDFFSHVRDGLNFGTQVGFLWIKEAEEQTGTPEGPHGSM
uniref:Purine nucleoside phosphorylase LACC1 n=1 Tax=Oryzias latipes TaxID=8090 RepID=A0A3P9J398_ORYLA